ncbi:unnamed protein product [Parnassius apollo]|uniref:(apollo) hypothetical protein n=1 Tax=Parnassius apollo TaxID=110799 RepID=A0A8S3Y4T6_PARAO|nr:unnamed protein product [Parnassius apollo]
MATSENVSASMFMQKGESKSPKSPTGSELVRKNSTAKTNIPVEIITVKDFFDFMKTAYQVYEHLEGNEEEGSKINWEELTKLTVINHVIEKQERDLLYQTAFTEQKPIISKSDTALAMKNNELVPVEKRLSYSEIECKGLRRSLPAEFKVEMLGAWTEANLNCKLNDVINEGILDSILPYLVEYKKPSKTTSAYTPIIKKNSSTNVNEVKKPASFGGFINEKESKDRLGRRKSSVIAAQERCNQKQDGDVEIHVCDEIKGLKKDFRCPQKLLVSKMGYFADVTAGQRLEDMDISVHCDIQIFDWLMRWVKRDTILVADWPLLDPHNVVPILVSASFLQMEPLLHDCLIFCHAHMNDIVKTSTNLACLSDTLLTSLAAMYTNAELEAVRDRRDKIQSRLYCKLILSLAEPVPETLRGHYATLATLFKCTKCNKLLGRHVAEQVPCQPSSMRIDRRGNVISSHTKDLSWSLNEYITWLYGELRSWRRVYWRLWADCHFLRCQLCDTYFPVYQMEWCSHHEQSAALVAGDAAAGRYPCCGQRAYRFETLPRNTGCQFREHVPEERTAGDAAVAALYTRFRDLIAMRPPHLVFPERLTRLVAREYQKVVRKTEGERYCSSWFAYKHLLFLLNASPKKLRIDEQVENSDESCDDGEEELETEVVLDEDKLNDILQPVTESTSIHQARRELSDNVAFNINKLPDDPYKDEYGLFGEFIAYKLRKLGPRNRILAQQRIGDVLFALEMEEVNEEVIYDDEIRSNSSKQNDTETEVKVSPSSPFQNDTLPKSPTYED